MPAAAFAPASGPGAPGRGTVLMSALTYEINGWKDGFDITPGANLSLNWGASQLAPMRDDRQLLLELGAAGFDTWQVSDAYELSLGMKR